jgi:hypothetical protein
MRREHKSRLGRRKFMVLASTGALGVIGWSHDPTVEAAQLGKPTLSYDQDISWREFQNKIYGAKPDETGPIGGGKGYVDAFTQGDFEVSDVEELLQALSEAKAGQVIYMDGDTVIDLTPRIYVEQLILKIPPGVILASNRGTNASEGALICSDTLNTKVMMRAAGPGVRITGIRLQGPNPKRHMEHHARSFGPNGLGREYYYRFPVSRGIETSFPIEIDNCELSAFSQCAVYLKEGTGHHIHHNFIHQCQYNGLGYGVSHNTSFSVIEYNLFDENRHSIAGTGASGSGYIARHNVEAGISLSHCFDMHGGRDRKDGTEIAGTSIEIYNNTFRAPQRAVVIRGTPEERCDIYQNWFAAHANEEAAVRGISERTAARNNAYGASPSMSNIL